MINTIRGWLADFFKSRLLIIGLFFFFLCSVLVYRLFQLQIVNGETYESTTEVRALKENVLSCSRGLIYDCNGEVLAYNELVYSVVIEDSGTYDDLSEKNETLNPALLKLFQIIESNGDSLVNDFPVVLNQSDEYVFTEEGSSQRTFLINVYGVSSYDSLTEEQQNASAEEVMEYLCNESHYDLSAETYSKEEILKIVTVRYGMSQNNYQKYITTTVASDVSAETVAIVMENSEDLPGVSIEEDTIRKYSEDSIYASHIIGYTGAISDEELSELQNIDEKYTESYMVGKSGIEEAMETVLQGTQGSESFYVDSQGRVLEVAERTESIAGSDVYLTIDIQLQKTVYQILEQTLAGIISSKIVSTSAYETRKISDSEDVVISIDDVFFALIDNNVIDIGHFSEADASETEQAVYTQFSEKKQSVETQISSQLNSSNAEIYNNLSEEMQSYMDYIEDWLISDGLIVKSSIDTSDEAYTSWTNGESSLRDYLYACISNNWVDVTQLSVEDTYADADEFYNFMISQVIASFETNVDFQKTIYEYMILDKELGGASICLILFDQGVLEMDETAYQNLKSGSQSAANFIISKIESLEITPAQLALDPCSASAVITDVETGEVKALVTYPSYDNNKLANQVDADYYSQLLNDQSLPLYNYATQQKTAPGSTFKMITAIAGMEEDVITSTELITDEGIFEKVSNKPRCWYYPSTHGSINVSTALMESCNYFFYEVGYRLSTNTTGQYDEDQGIELLTKYAEMFGLGEKSGIEIEESSPNISSVYPVMSAIGQGEHNYTTVQLAKYVTAIANGGTVYNLTLIDKITSSDGTVIQETEPDIYYQTDFSQTTWNAVHSGMRSMALSTTALSSLDVAVAGKTGTAQESTYRPNHALFVGYAPYEDPEISVAIKIAYGYTSSNAVSVAKDIFNYYFELEDYDDVVSSEASDPGEDVIGD